MLTTKMLLGSIRRATRLTAFVLTCAVFIALACLWVRSLSRTDAVQWFSQKTTGSLGREEWLLATYRGGLLLDTRDIVYEVRESDPGVPDSSSWSFNSRPSPQSAADVNAGKLGFVATRYSDVVRQSPVVTQMGQSIGLPFWLLSIVFGIWPIIRTFEFSRRLASRAPVSEATATELRHNPPLERTAAAV
jgi:hypothetical protein